MPGGFPEADTRIHGDAVLRYARGQQCVAADAQVLEHLGGNVCVDRFVLHGARRALLMHQADAATGFDRQREHVRVALKRGDVVDDLGAGVDGRFRHQGFRGVYRNGQVGFFAQRLQHGHYPAEFLLGIDRRRARAGAFAADVEDVGPFGGQLHPMRYRFVGVEKSPAIGKTVRRDVDDSHQQGEFA